MNEDTIVTLIGMRMAKPGIEFIFKGESPDCNGCRLKSTCMNLDRGSRYRVVDIRNPNVLDCSIHEGGVQAVEVVEQPLTVLVESRMALEGSTIYYESIPCNESGCEMFEMCHNPGLVPGNKYIIVTVVGEPEGECKKGYSLKAVEMKR